MKETTLASTNILPYIGSARYIPGSARSKILSDSLNEEVEKNNHSDVILNNSAETSNQSLRTNVQLDTATRKRKSSKKTKGTNSIAKNSTVGFDESLKLDLGKINSPEENDGLSTNRSLQVSLKNTIKR